MLFIKEILLSHGSRGFNLKNTDAKDTDFEASIEPVFFKCLLIEDLFWKSSSQSFFSVLCGSVFNLSQEILLEALIKSVLKKHLLGKDF